MPRNGSGGYALPTGINPVITQTLITSSWANTTLADVAAAITQSIAKDGQTIPTNNLPMGGFRHTGVGDPVLRDNYATLGFIQDGSHYQLINIAGNNAISSTLPGGLTSYSLGMIVQLQPVATSTGPVTLDVNGIGPRQIVSSVGNQLGAGDLLVGQAYILMFNGTAWEMLNGGDSSAFAQAAMSGWDRPASVAYPPITQVNPTTISVPGGTGRIINPSTRDISGVTEVTWATQNVVLTSLASAWVTIIAVNASGQIVQLTGSMLPTAARSNIILGIVTHITGTIDSIKTRPAIYGDMTYTAYDITSVFNNMLLSGGIVSQNATAMHMDLGAGFIFQMGGNADQPAGPNIVPFAGQANFNFYPITGASTNAALTNIAPVGNYDPAGAGTITAIPGGAGTAAIHRLYLLGATMTWLYGQNIYTDMITAIREWPIDTQTLKLPAKLNNATLIATIIATKGCVSLATAADCRLVPAGGTSYSIGTAGSIGDAPVDGSSYGRKNAGWSKVVDQVVNGDGITVDSTNPNKPIVAMGATFAGPKTLTSGNLFLSASSLIFYSNVAMTILGTSVDGADNQSIQIGSGGALATTRGAYLQMYGNEAGGGLAGQALLWSGNGQNITLGGGKVVIPNGGIDLTDANANIVFSNVDTWVRMDTADSTDTKTLQLAGGGAPSATRGGYIALLGNENAAAPTAAGCVIITAGNAATGQVRLEGGDVKVTGGRFFGTALHNNASGLAGPTNQYVGSGTYTPTLFNTTNVSSSSAQVCQWMRVGNVVTVSGRIDVTPTAASTLTVVGISLPIASNFDSFQRCMGAGVFSGGTIVPCTIASDFTNDRATMSFIPSVNTSNSTTWTFTYLVL